MKKMKCIKKMMISVILAVILLSHLALPAFAEEEAADADYKLEQVVVLSRHNLRAPLSSNGSVPQELTPHTWIQWTSNSSELTIKGGIQETSMGQYFRKWLDQEGLIPENSVPEEGEVRFNARGKQRCRATARYFAAGMLPLADITVEYPGDDAGTVDFMNPVLNYYTEAYGADATAQVAANGGDEGFEGISKNIRDGIRLIMDTVDMEDSEGYKSGKYGNLLADGSGFQIEAEKEPDMTGAIKTASQVADALVLQYYEEPDVVKAAFGHELSDEDWAKIGGFLSNYLKLKHGEPLVAGNITNPLLQELKSELKNEKRKFSFFCAHDCTVLGVVSALGAKDYTLPDSIEAQTPIGVKLLFERWRDKDGSAWYRVNLVYRSTEQIRNSEVLTLDNPPMRYDLTFEGVNTNKDGLISEADLFAMFDRSIGALDEMKEKYGAEEEEASQKAAEAEETKETAAGTEETKEAAAGAEETKETAAGTEETKEAAAGAEETIEYWNPSSPAMQSIVEFVTKSVDEGSDGFIPKEERVAVFDMDGTLYGERFPTYFNDWLFIQRALYDDSYKAPKKLRTFAKKWEDKVLKGIPIENFDEKERELGPKLYEGLTPEAYAEVVRKFKDLPVWGFEGMTYAQAYFQPMTALVKYLYEHDYNVYIVSATYRDAVRVMTEGILDQYIPADHVIGTDLLYTASGDEDENSMFYELEADDELEVAGSLFIKNQKTNKVTSIQREIGRIPVLAFGNSTGDFSMATYTLQNKKYGGRAYMLLCDDTERDYGDPEAAAEFKNKCFANGFYTISEKDEFTLLYPEGVQMEQENEEEVKDAA